MTYEEWRDMTKLLMAFHDLPPDQREMIFLMMDGLKHRAIEYAERSGRE